MVRIQFYLSHIYPVLRIGEKCVISFLHERAKSHKIFVDLIWAIMIQCPSVFMNINSMLSFFVVAFETGSLRVALTVLESAL